MLYTVGFTLFYSSESEDYDDGEWTSYSYDDEDDEEQQNQYQQEDDEAVYNPEIGNGDGNQGLNDNLMDELLNADEDIWDENGEDQLPNENNPEINVENADENDNIGMGINNLDITWQGVIGVDGSFQFFEHVFYALIINGVALYVFWVTPMVIGKFVFEVFSSNVPRIMNPIKTGVFIMLGYTFIAICLGAIGKLRRILYVRKRMKFLYIISRFSNNVYLWMKVALLMFNELMVYPTIIGVWINICTIDMVGNNLEFRIKTFEKNPLSTLFFHWFAGMTIVFQFVSAVMAIRKVTRPGLIWFVRNLDDQDYSPLKDMLESSGFIHIKRFCYTCALLGWCIFVCVWIPSTVVKTYGVIDLPFSKANYTSSENITDVGNSTKNETGDSSNESYLNPITILNDIPKHFILLQILVPMLNVDGQRLASKFLSKFIKVWCIVVGQILGLKSYLMGMSDDNSDETGMVYQPKMVTRNDNNNNNIPGGARRFEMGKYRRKKFFQFRILGFLGMLVVTLSLIFGVLLFVPILTGRRAIYQIHKIYVAASNEPRLDGPKRENLTAKEENPPKYGQSEVVNAWILGAFLLWVPINLIYIVYKSCLKTLPMLKNLQIKDYRATI